jgi:hypothetical protein
MSDIAAARELIEQAINHIPPPSASAQRLLRKALVLMWREPPVRKAPAKPTIITPEIRKLVKELNNSGLTEHQIAERVGLRNGGRISEILHPPKKKRIKRL